MVIFVKLFYLSMSFLVVAGNNMETKDCGDKLLSSIFNYIEKAGNNLSPKPSNPHLFTIFRVILFPKKSHTVTRLSTTTEKHPEEVSITESISTSTEQFYDDDDDSTRSIKFVDTKTFDFGESNKLSRKMPEVEHGSVQYRT